jgi:hypothetical protein
MLFYYGDKKFKSVSHRKSETRPWKNCHKAFLIIFNSMARPRRNNKHRLLFLPGLAIELKMIGKEL